MPQPFAAMEATMFPAGEIREGNRTPQGSEGVTQMRGHPLKKPARGKPSETGGSMIVDKRKHRWLPSPAEKKAAQCWASPCPGQNRAEQNWRNEGHY